jgi:hypothetical protein
MKRAKILGRLVPDPDCPTLAWMIAKRVTDPTIKLDCTIMITGKKGTGKSIFSISLAYEIAKCIVIIKNRDKLRALSPVDRKKLMDIETNKLFNMEHIKTVDKDGTMEMFSGDIIKTYNSILLCDDVSIAANSRNSMTLQNKWISQIMTVTRPFRNVTILNTVYSSLVDKAARGFSDIVIELLGVDKKNKRSIAKVFLYSINQTSSKEYRKFFTWHGKRIKYWACYAPPKWMKDEYEQMREDKTVELLDEIQGDHNEKKDKKAGSGKRAKREEEIINTYKDKVLEMYYSGKYSQRAIARISPELSLHWVGKIIAIGEQEKMKQGVI